MKKIIKHTWLQAVILIILFFVTVELASIFIVKPLLRQTLYKQVYQSTDSTYLLAFDKFKINIFSGNITLVDFQMKPDTANYFIKHTSIEKNLYEINLDTFKIEHLKWWQLLKREKTLVIDKIIWINPQLAVLGASSTNTKSTKLEEKPVSYQTVRQDFISSAFAFVNSLRINKIELHNGNFDFLKPREDNPNPFSIGSITFILNNFYADKNIFSSKPKDIFSENIEMIIDDYHLKLNDNIHILDAQRVYLNTAEKTIELSNITMKPDPVQQIDLDTVKSNLIDVSISKIKFNNADFKDIYVNNRLYLSKAYIDDFVGKVYKQKVKEEKKTFNKDSLINKMDIYKLFSNYLSYVKIDTMELVNGIYSQFDKYSSNLPKISVANVRFAVYDFFIDSMSFADTTRILYSHSMELNMYGFKMRLNDSIHSLTADYVVASTEKNGLLATNVKIAGDEKLRNFAIDEHKSFNNVVIAALNVSGFNFNRFVHFDELIVDKIQMKKSSFDLNNYAEKKKNTKVSNQELVHLFQNFADKIIVNKIAITDGFLNYHSKSDGKNIYISGKYRANIFGFVFEPYSEKITKWARVAGVNAVLTNFYLNTADSIYQLTADTLKYSTYSSDLQLINAKFKPIQAGLISHLKQNRKSLTFEIDIPKFEISNTNISSAFQADSLSLKNVTFNNPSFILKLYPDIKPKKSNKAIIKYIKKNAVANIVRISTESEVSAYVNTDEIDSATYNILKIKRFAIDSITKFAVSTVLSLNIKQKQVDFNDTTVSEILQIEQIATENIKEIAQDSLSVDDVYLVMYQTLTDIDFVVKSGKWAKIDKEEIFRQIGAFLPKIVSDTFVVNNGKIILEKCSDTTVKTVFSTVFDLSLYGFSFDTTNLDSSNKILFSNNFLFSIENTVFNLGDSIHQIRVKKLLVSSEKSSIIATKVKIVHKFFDDKKLIYSADIDKIEATGVDFKQLYFSHNFFVNSFDFYEPQIAVYLPKPTKQKQKRKKLPLKILLPQKISQLNIKDIKVHSGSMKLQDMNSPMTLNFDFDFDLMNFLIDSVTKIKENKFFIPIENFTFDIENFNYLSKDSSQKITAKSIGISSQLGALDIRNFEILPVLPDTISKKNYLRNKKILHLFIDEVDLAGFDISKYRFENKINLRKLIVSNPKLTITKLKNEEKIKFELDSFDLANKVDLYDKIKKFTSEFKCKYLKISKLSYETNELSDSNYLSKKAPIVNLTFTDLLIDSTTKVDTPQLFYAKDFAFDIFGFSGFTKDSIYKFSTKKISGSTLNKSIIVDGFKFSPTVSLEDVQKFYDWRTTALSVNMNMLMVSNLDFYNLIFKHKINAQLISGDSVEIYTFVDRRAPHNDSVLQKHFIEHILDLKYPVNIKLVNLTNVYLYYSELNDVNKQLANISLTRANLKIIRVTNNIKKIEKNDLYSLIRAKGYINDTAQLTLDIFYNLQSRGSVCKVVGSIGECDARLFNSYTVNGANLKLEKGTIHSLNFIFKTNDTLAIGNLKMKYDDLKVSVISKDTVNRKKLKFLSWAADVLFVKNSNPKYGVYVKPGKIAYIHDRTYSDVKMWLKALLSGIQSTVAYEPKDAKKIRKIMRKNKKKVE